MMTSAELRWETEKADAGDKLAQYRVAMHHKPTSSIYSSNSDFEKYIKLSAEQGFFEAQLEYAVYAESKAGSNNECFIEAVKYYYLAALQGDVSAIAKLQTSAPLHRRLENFSKEGSSSSYSYSSWSNQASMQIRATYWLGKLFSSDFLEEKNTGRAIEFYRQAVERKYILAGNELAKIFDNGLGVEKNRAEAIRLLKTICDSDNGYFSSGENNFNESHYLLGTMYHFAEGAEKDIPKAISAYEKADRQNHKGAALKLGHIYREKANQARKENPSSYDVRRHKDKALECYKKNEHDKSVQNFIGLVYDADKDYPNAVFWFEKAAQQGLTVAQCNLAMTYDDVKSGVQDKRKAVLWYKTAAENGYANAQYYLAGKYESGVEGVLVQDAEQANSWYKKAADQGHKEAKAKLETMHKKALLEAMNEQGQPYLKDNPEYLEKYEALENALEYKFKDPYELFNALDRRSDPDNGEPYFQSYEFLGDGILNAAIRTYLFENKPDSMKLGAMERIYQNMVGNKAILLEIAKKFNLSTLIIRGEAETQHVITDGMQADHMEAIIGAVREDGGYEKAEKLIVCLWKPFLDAALTNASVAVVASSTQQSLASSLRSPATVVSTVSSSPPVQPSVITVKRQTSAGSLKFYSDILSLSIQETEAQLSAHPNRANACSSGGQKMSVLAVLVNSAISVKKESAISNIVGKINTLIKYRASWDLANEKGETPRAKLNQVPAEVRRRLTMK